MADNPNSDDDATTAFLAPVIKMWKDHPHQNLEEATKAWEHAMHAFPTLQTAKSKQPSLWSSFNSDTRKAKKALSTWFKSTNTLSNKDIRRLERLPLFKFTANGEAKLKQAPLPIKWANGLLYILWALGGAFSCWIWLAAVPGLTLIIQSFGVGIVLGSLGSLILDLSHRHEDIAKKLAVLAPRLNS
ncbi:hypothetical protein [Methylobacillus glycogenes]|uniref:hypothetical protein n=1 Tax=Methylobacillus glycogenes TaxID=406 RepID=UPI0004720AB4|nr:hypothetical protein [Methylobacillus glycogenes]